MSEIQEAEISSQIELAFSLAKRGANPAAANAFAAARALTVERFGAAELLQRVNGHTAALGRERASYRDMIAARRSCDRTLLILADSLGLPRPDAKNGPTAGADETYPMMVLDRLPGHQVDSHCQRYFTARSVLEVLQVDETLGVGADVVVHVGLNDCATRIFQEPQRLALDALTPELKDRIVLFGQRYRRLLLAELPALHYVDPDDFTSSLHAIVELLRLRSAGRILLTTIILPPERFWPATPGLNANFADYNHRIMKAAAQTGATLFDLDRLAWARLHESVMLDDGMHLSPKGHALFADELAKLIV